MNVGRQGGYNWLGVMDFIQTEFSRNQLREKQWAFERQTMTNKITKLQAQAKMHETVHLDLLKRIQMLEMALRDERSGKRLENKPSIQLHIEPQKTQEQLLAEAKKFEKSDNMQFLERILNDIGIEVTNQSTNLKQSEGKGEKRTVFNLVSHLDGVRDIFYNANFQCLTSLSEDCLIKFWDLSALERRGEIQAKISVRQHTGPLFSASGTPSDSESNLVFTGGSEGIIKAWQVQGFKAQLSSFDYSQLMKGDWRNFTVDEPQETAIWQLAYQDDKLVTSSSDSAIRIHSLTYDYKQSKLKTVKGDITKSFVNKDKLTNTIFNPTCVSWLNNTSIINGYNNLNALTSWDLVAQRISDTYKYTTDNQPNSVFNQTNKIIVNSIMGLLLCAHQDNCIRAFEIGSKKVVKKLDHADSVSCLALSSRNRWCLYAGSHDGTIKVWDIRKNLCLEQIHNVHLKKYDESIHSILYIDELSSIVTAGADGLVKIYQS